MIGARRRLRPLSAPRGPPPRSLGPRVPAARPGSGTAQSAPGGGNTGQGRAGLCRPLNVAVLLLKEKWDFFFAGRRGLRVGTVVSEEVASEPQGCRLNLHGEAVRTLLPGCSEREGLNAWLGREAERGLGARSRPCHCLSPQTPEGDVTCVSVQGQRLTQQDALAPPRTPQRGAGRPHMPATPAAQCLSPKSSAFQCLQRTPTTR